MDITNPRRILAVSSADATQHLSRVIKDLTGTHPEPTGPSLAGTTHNLALKTAYYAAEVPIWLDLVSSPSEWAASFLSPEAKEVLDILGGVVVVFALPANAKPGETADDGAAGAARDLIRNVGRVVREGLGGWEWDGVGLCVGVGEAGGGGDDDGQFDEWEDCCAEWGLEFVQVRGHNNHNTAAPERNEFGADTATHPDAQRAEKTGIPRILEALESNDWSQAPSPADGIIDDLDSEFGDFEGGLTGGGGGSGKDLHSSTTKGRKHGVDGNGDDDDSADLDPESLDFGFDREDFAGLRRAIWTAGRDDDEDEDEVGNNKGLVSGEPSGTMRRERLTEGGPAGGGGGDGAGDGDGDGDDTQLDDEEVRKLERMMVKLQAVRDMSAGLPDDQRKRMAARAVGEVMKEL
ncbi:hypothetical protein SLS62_010857 [Diatrype stigma]|uniref:Alpha and gamma adaptin binding protein p34 n=1 Tax=Diatrype stigma TaxID=117547 RepID=A0AAN9YF97_9PEZI